MQTCGSHDFEISWGDFEKSIVEVGPGRHFAFAFFADSTDDKPTGTPVKNREGQLAREWLAIRIVEQEVRDEFLERLHREGLAITGHEGRVI